MIKFPIKNFWFSQSVVYPNLVRLYHQIGRISELSADMNKLCAIWQLIEFGTKRGW
ncbi:MAG: hypothetical protein ACUVQT_04430 [bacterium]